MVSGDRITRATEIISNTSNVSNDLLHRDTSEESPAFLGILNSHNDFETYLVKSFEGCNSCKRVNCRTSTSNKGDSHHSTNKSWSVFLLVVFVSAIMIEKASASCTKGVTELWAYSNPSFEEFHDSYRTYISSSRGAVCRWVVIASKKSWSVRLHFDPLELKQETEGKRGDCLEIYDGSSDDDPLLDRVCDNNAGTYVSKGRKLFVVYRRGLVPGQRKIGFVYKAEDDDSKEKLIQIAAIVGGGLGALGLIYLLLRYSGCAKRFRNKANDPEDANHTQITHPNSNHNERDRLTLQVADLAEVDRNNTNNNNSSINGGASAINTTTLNTGETSFAEAANNNSNSTGHNIANGNTTARNSHHSESDSDSLHTLNELPPSYESLYLNDDGEIEPPPYTPPKHQIKNPPRRVHTFN